jgi:ribokinase
MTSKIAVVGSLNIDLVIRTNKIPQPGETVLGGELSTTPGGKGANQAVAAARLGAEVAMVGRVGNDVVAGQLKNNLAQFGVDLAHVKDSDGFASGLALIVVDNAGQNTIVVAAGANGRLTPGDVEAAAGAIRSADVLLLQLEIPLQAVVRAAQIAQKHDTRVVLNPAPAQPLPEELLALVDVLIPNESESALLADMPVQSRGECVMAAARLLSFGIGTVILTLGSQGALLTQAERRLFFPAFRADQVVDTTAAGDAFVGGLATALAEGRSMVAAIPWGNAAGAISVTRAGAQPSLPSRADVESLLSQASGEQLCGVEP